MTFTWRFTYGGTTIAVAADPSSALDENQDFWLEVLLSADGATNAQNLWVRSELREDAATGAADFIRNTTGTAAVDSTVAQTATLTGDWGTAPGFNPSVTLLKMTAEHLSL